MNGLQTDLYLIRREEEYKNLKKELESVKKERDYLQEKCNVFQEKVWEMRQQLAECERERGVWKESYGVLESQYLEQLATVTKERDELKANSDRYELLREMKLYEMMEYRCLPVPLEDADDWFDAQTDAKIRERYPRATIGADKTGEQHGN